MFFRADINEGKLKVSGGLLRSSSKLKSVQVSLEGQLSPRCRSPLCLDQNIHSQFDPTLGFPPLKIRHLKGHQRHPTGFSRCWNTSNLLFPPGNRRDCLLQVGCHCL